MEHEEEAIPEQTGEKKMASSTDTRSDAMVVKGPGHASTGDSAPPDIGSGAWLQVLGSSFIWLNTLSVLSS
jgi:hypothetical protein